MKFLFLLMLMVSCATPLKSPNETAVIIMDPITVPAETAPVVVEQAVKIEIVSLTGFNDSQAERFRKIVKNCETVLNSKEFREAILAHYWQGKKQFVDTTDTNEQVLAKLLSKTWTLEYKLEAIKRPTPWSAWTVGYTYPKVNWIVFNSLLFDSKADHAIADNIFHEYGGHKLGGYNHAKIWSESRDYSAPYGIGYIAEKIYIEKFGDK